MHTSPATVPRLPDGLRPVLRRLLAEHAGALPAGTVIHCLTRCHYELHRAGVRAGLPDAAEAMARRRLDQLPTSPATGRD